MNRLSLIAFLFAVLLGCTGNAAPPAPPAPPEKAIAANEPPEKPAAPSAPQETSIKLNDADLKLLHPDSKVWVDAKQKLLVMEGKICLTRGTLEMLACPENTSKEHESIIVVSTKAQVVHAGLLAIGAKPGSPVSFRPEFKAATGQEINVYVMWEDEKGMPHQTRAQNWIRAAKTQQAMTDPWVFTGSNFWKDDDGKEHYQAESGHFICVSNLPGAMMDLPVETSHNYDELSYEAFTERIPEKGTKVKIVLVPKVEEKKEGEKKVEDAKPDNKK